MADIIQIRRGTTSQWTSANPILAVGEYGYDTTTKQQKVGDGTNRWNDLPYTAPTLVHNHSAAEITSGTIPDARLAASPFAEVEVANVAALATTTVANGKTVALKGYYATGDGGGQTLYYDSSSTATVNGGTVFNGPGGVGRFLSLDPNTISVKTFGAKGDGTTDDHARIQAAIDYADSPLQNGQLTNVIPIRVPVGIYKISQPLLCRSGTKIVGDGIASRISPTGGFAGAGLLELTYGTVDWCQDVIIENLGFDGAFPAVTDTYYSVAVTGTASTDTFNATAHGIANGQRVWIKVGTLVGGSGLTVNTTYHVINSAANTFQLSATSGGSPVNFTTDISSATIVRIPSTNLRCELRNLFCEGTDCIVLNNYNQACTFEKIYSGGNVNRLLHFSGNWNVLRHINKEGGTGTSADPYIKISHIFDGNRSDGNHIYGINIEGLGNANKTPFHFDGVDNLCVQNLWCELQGTAGSITDNYVMRIEDSFNVNFFGTPTLQIPVEDSKIKIDSTYNVYFEQLYLDPTAASVYSIFEVNDDSNVAIGTLVTRGNDGSIKCDQASNFRIHRIFSKNNNLTTGTTQFTETLYTGNNLLVNGSFENARHGWSIDSGGTVTTTLVDSGVSLGKALQCSISPTGGFNVHQNVVFNSEHVGKPFTFTGAVKTTSVGGYITPFINGAGILLDTNLLNIARNGDWTIISQTFIPQSAGTCAIGVYCWSLTSALLDEFSVTPGTVGTLASSSFKSLELNGRSVTYGNAAPTSGQGTWRIGDLRINSEPATDEDAFWVCTGAGDPGTWQSVGRLSNVKRVYGTPSGKQIEIDATSDPAFKVWNEATNLGWQIFHFSGINYVDTDTTVRRNRQTGDVYETWSAAGGLVFNAGCATGASTTAKAPLNIPHGTAPTSPVNGDIWTTTAGLFVRINGVTVGPLS
jgi:hypothetical protein